jgi:hypothetical protein
VPSGSKPWNRANVAGHGPKQPECFLCGYRPVVPRSRERVPVFADTWERIAKLYGWPETFVGGRGNRHTVAIASPRRSEDDRNPQNVM